MAKKFHLMAFLALMLASCADDLSERQSSLATDDRANSVAFDAYTLRNLQTRSGYTGLLTTNLGSHNLQTEGFGVFAYYTGVYEYSQSSSIPNFMYNQKVEFNSLANVWDYTPTKYWPNEYGDDAESEDLEKVSFFAYAPYVACTPNTGKVADDSYGITGFTRNTQTGDPCVRYLASFDPAKSVDLCWGYVGTAADAVWSTVQDNGAQSFKVGFPWLNVQRPAKTTGQRMKFLFKHALSQLNVQVDADPDITVTDETTQIGTLPDGTTEETGGTKTKVYVRSVSFKGFAMRGSLCLNNGVAYTPCWYDYDNSGKSPSIEAITIHDGLRDGKEGTGTVDTNERLTGINSDLISDAGNNTAGVTHALTNLFGGASLSAPVCVIPNGDDLTITIAYDVETANDKLAGYLSDGMTRGYISHNVITKTVSLGGESGGALVLKAGNSYTVKLHLGMNSVKFSASVGEWTSAGDDSGWVPDGDNSTTLFITDSSDEDTEHVLVTPASAATLKAVVSEDHTDEDIIWEPQGNVASKVALSSKYGNSITVRPAEDYVGPVTLRAIYRKSGKYDEVTVYCSHNAADMVKNNVQNDEGLVVATDGLLYQHTDHVTAYSETSGAKGIAMVAYVPNKYAIALADYNSTPVLSSVAKAVTNDQFNSTLGEPSGTQWSLPPFKSFQQMFMAVGQNGWSNISYRPIWGFYCNQTFTGAVTRRFFPMNSDGLNESDMFYKTSVYFDKGGFFYDKSSDADNGMTWKIPLEECEHNIMISYGLFRKALVDCGGTNVRPNSYLMDDDTYISSSPSYVWRYSFYDGTYWFGYASSLKGYLRPILKFNSITIKNNSSQRIDYILAPAAGVTVNASVENVVSPTINWSLIGENASKATLTSYTGTSTTVKPVGTFVGTVTLRATDPVHNTYEDITVYCTHAATAMTAADNGRVVATDGNVYLHTGDVNYSNGAKAVAMVGDGANKKAIALYDYYEEVDGSAKTTFTLSQALAITPAQFAGCYGAVTGSTGWSLITSTEFQRIFMGVGQNGWTQISHTTYRGYYTDQTFTGAVTKKFWPLNSDGLDVSEMFERTSVFFDKGGMFNYNLNTNGMNWTANAETIEHNVWISYGLFRKALVDCGGTNVISYLYWLKDAGYDTGMSWYYTFNNSNFWYAGENAAGYVRPVLSF